MIEITEHWLDPSEGLCLHRITEHREPWIYIQVLTEIIPGDYSIREAGLYRPCCRWDRLFRFTYVFDTFSYLPSIFSLPLKIKAKYFARTKQREKMLCLNHDGRFREADLDSLNMQHYTAMVGHISAVNPVIVPCGGGLEYPHRSPTSRRRWQEGNPVPGGYNWATLSLGDIHTEIWSSRLGIGLKAEGLAL
jgi:hypothetical protein